MGLVASITEDGRDFWIGQNFLSESVRNSLRDSDVVITPLLNFRDGIAVSFHQGTVSFLDYLSIGLQENHYKVEICAPDNEYYEIALHSRAHRLSNIVVTNIAAPLAVSLMASYIYDELKAKPNDTISTSITIEQADCKTSKIEFDGNVKDFPLVIDEVKRLSEPCEEGSERPESLIQDQRKEELKNDNNDQSNDGPRTKLV